MMNSEDQQQVQLVAQEVLKYINKRPNTAETVEGVTDWWVSRQRVEGAEDIVEKALEYLVEQKKLQKHSLGNQALYTKAD